MKVLKSNSANTWTYCKLKDGREMVVMDNNTEKEIMHVFPVHELDDLNIEYLSCVEVYYSHILRTDRNRVVAFM